LRLVAVPVEVEVDRVRDRDVDSSRAVAAVSLTEDVAVVVARTGVEVAPPLLE